MYTFLRKMVVSDFFALFFLFISCTVSAHHKIIIQISPPRCLSTASLRMWQARGDFIVMNEPFISAFVQQEESDRQLTSGWWHEDAPQTFQEAHNAVLAQAEHGPVFVKELGFSFVEYLHTNTDLIDDPNVYFVFLLRHPHAAISSYYQGHEKIIEKFSYLAGFQSCYDIWRMVQERGANKPHVVCSEDLYSKPYETAQALCNAVGIPFVEHMLHWDNLGDSFNGIEAWHELKNRELLYKWHQPAITGTCFHEPTRYDVDAEGIPTFAEVTSSADRDACVKAYYENMIWYEKLLQEAAIR